MPLPPFTKISLKISYLKSNWNLPRANELNKVLNLLPHLSRYRDFGYKDSDEIIRHYNGKLYTVTSRNQRMVHRISWPSMPYPRQTHLQSNSIFEVKLKRKMKDFKHIVYQMRLNCVGDFPRQQKNGWHMLLTQVTSTACFPQWPLGDIGSDFYCIITPVM